MPTHASASPSSSPLPHPLAAYGWDDRVAAAVDRHPAPGLTPARVIRVQRGSCDLMTADGPVRATTAAVASADPTRVPCTGDWALLGPDSAGAWTVHALLPRRSAFLRSASSKASRGQVLAANVELAVIAVSLAEELVLGRVERFVTLAWSSGAEPLVVLTKADLVPEPAPLLADVGAAAPGTEVYAVSARTGAGVDALTARLAGRTSVLLGVSGAGKSTLANRLLGAEVQRVNAVRDQDGKGRHTTTTRDLHPLPGGGTLIDTPGLRGVGLWDAEEGVGRAFPDVEELAASCRFADCGHRTEPGCAVLEAVEDGSLPQRRLDSYRKLLRENAHLAARADARLRAELRRESKRQVAAGRLGREVKRRGR